MVDPGDIVVRLPDFVAEIQFSVKLVQGECMDVGLVQGQGFANMIQLIS